MRIGVDLGGTSIRAGLADKGTLLRKERLRCPSKGSCGEVLDAIEEVISRVMHPGVESVGIGVPSVVDTARGIVYNAANIPSWKEVPLKDMMQKRLGLEVNVNNDSNCFTLGESLFGKCRDCSDIVGLTIGTGVGSGIIINGRLYEGRNAGAGEIGSLPYLGKDFESWCSTPFFTANGTTGAEAAEAASSGDAGAIALWNEYGVHLGELVKAILYIYDPEAIVIGGGLAAASGLYRDSLSRQLSSFAYPNSAASVRLLFADNTDMALLGAASLKDK